MKLTANIFNTFINIERRHIRLKEAFTEFTKQQQFFSESKCPIHGVMVTLSEEGEHFDVAFATIKVRFQFLVSCTIDGPVVGKVVCILQQPSFTETQPVIGAFTFNAQGITDFETPAGADQIELSNQAFEIVLHFLNLALEYPSP